MKAGISRGDAARFIRATGRELLDVFQAASSLRDARTGRVITYSRKVFIPLTNLCRDRCGYCTFAREPGDGKAHTMTPDEVLAVARAGREAGCKEALFSLGDKPELRYPEYREWLEARGFRSTIEYLRAMCQLVFEETGLLPHANPGVLSREEMELLRPVNASMGMMLESASARLLAPGEAHYRCPDKVPKVRLAALEAAGQLQIPFTTGILIGIGETLDERVDALFAIRELARKVRAHPGSDRAELPCQVRHAVRRSHGAHGAGYRAHRGRCAADPGQRGESPGATQSFAGCLWIFLLAGINDWGGISPVTRDFINPEMAWPQIAALRAVTGSGIRVARTSGRLPGIFTRPGLDG